jgi:hypothetical protein
MKYYWIVALFSISVASAQTTPERNVFIITTDGFRWQEVFSGADPDLLSDINRVADTALCKQLFDAPTPEERRRKLLPFFWSVLAAKGQLNGNQNYQNKVQVANPYKISYPGYQEMLTGKANSRLSPNWPINNPQTTVLEHIQSLEGYTGRVAAFSSWNIIPYIINEKKAGIPVNSGYEMLVEEGDTLNALINQVQQSIQPAAATRNDMLTYSAARNYIEKSHPKVLFLGFGETDEYAHKNQYDGYLQKAHQFDQFVADLWYYVQTDPFYKNNTTFIITTDHGRGKFARSWNSHGFWVRGSGDIWSAMIGPDLQPLGESKTNETRLLQHTAATVLQMLGIRTSSDAALSSLTLQRDPNISTTPAADIQILGNKIPQQNK